MGFPLPDSGSVTEDVGVVGGFLTASGDIDFGPFWNGDGGQWTAETLSGSYGSMLVIDSDGNWTYSADNSNALIQALATGGTLTEVFTVASSRGNSTITITINGADEPPSFVAGTLIDTALGPKPIEELRAGDRVLTRDNGEQVIRWAGWRHIRLAEGDVEAFQPIRIKKDSLAPGVPLRDVLLSPMHRVLLQGAEVQMLTGEREVLCPAGHLVNGQTILRDCVREVSYHHLLFDQHQVLRSSGVASESFLPGVVGINGFEDATREEMFALFPTLRSLPEGYGPTARRVTKGFEAEVLCDRLSPVRGLPRFCQKRVA